MHKQIFGMTLIELLLALILVTLVILNFSSIDLFSRHHLITSDRRAMVQNEASYVLEHMAKKITMAIGDINNPAVSTYWIPGAPGGRGLQVVIDFNNNGRRDSLLPNADHLIDYQFQPHNLTYYDVTNSTSEFISSHIENFYPDVNATNNFVSVDITACWDPAQTRYTCGTSDNPSVSMHAYIKMPAVSTN